MTKPRAGLHAQALKILSALEADGAIAPDVAATLRQAICTAPVGYRRRTPEEVREILLSEETAAVLAERYGCTESALGQIRLGKAYADLWPEIPRRGFIAASATPGALSCLNCTHWRGGAKPCAEGVPDASERDPGFANYCEFHARRSQVSESA